LEMIDDIIRHGARKDDRTGVGTISKFGAQMRSVNTRWQLYTCTVVEITLTLLDGQIQLARWSLPVVDYQESLLEGSCRGALVVHSWRYQRRELIEEGRQDLGR
jgi:hypothetical protein